MASWVVCIALFRVTQPCSEDQSRVPMQIQWGWETRRRRLVSCPPPGSPPGAFFSLVHRLPADHPRHARATTPPAGPARRLQDARAAPPGGRCLSGSPPRHVAAGGISRLALLARGPRWCLEAWKPTLCANPRREPMRQGPGRLYLRMSCPPGPFWAPRSLSCPSLGGICLRPTQCPTTSCECLPCGC